MSLPDPHNFTRRRNVPLCVAHHSRDSGCKVNRYLCCANDLVAERREAILQGNVAPGVPRVALFSAWRALRRFPLLMRPMPLPSYMHPAYADTHFVTPRFTRLPPSRFAILTAYATTGERWGDAENQTADRALYAWLRPRTPWLQRMTGFSPFTGHAEPGWAVALFYPVACAVGRRFHQDALYWVDRGVLYVANCQDERPIAIGPFWPRVHVVSYKNSSPHCFGLLHYCSERAPR